jgi:hypothetical protein
MLYLRVPMRSPHFHPALAAAALTALLLLPVLAGPAINVS